MPTATPLRTTALCLAAVLLSGCAGSGHRDADVPEDYFARQLPGLPGSGNVQMSAIDNPVAQLRSLQTPPPTLIRQALLEQHRRWEGTPYRLGGTSERGIDCSALVQHVYRDTFDLELPRSTYEQVKEGREIDRQALKAGDLVFFRPPGAYRHVGVYVGDGYFLHASTSQGVIISRLDNSYWQRYYWQARRALEPTRIAQLSRTL